MASSDIELTALPDRDATQDDMRPYNWTSRDHESLARWVADLMQRERRHSDQAIAAVRDAVVGLGARLHVIEERGEAAEKHREKVDAKLDAIGIQLARLQPAELQAANRAWLSAANMPWLMSAAMLLVLSAIVWGVIFGDGSVTTQIDHIRGTHQPAKE